MRQQYPFKPPQEWHMQDMHIKRVVNFSQTTNWVKFIAVVMTMLSFAACDNVTTETFVVDVTNGSSSIIQVRIAGNDQPPNLKPGDGHQYKVQVPCTKGDTYSSITSSNPCMQCFTVVAVKIDSRNVSTTYNQCISQAQIFSVTFRNSDF